MFGTGVEAGLAELKQVGKIMGHCRGLAYICTEMHDPRRQR